MSVFYRNFTAYFLNPTGYVFICVFVLLCSIAAFLPDEFVNSNLANLDQLNRWFPMILLFFAPAIAMGSWADERRFGTEELLMTMPVSIRTLLFGKYFAAAAIFLVSLFFAMASNYLILEFLGHPDFGLFLATCFGYALLGTAMLSIAMIASCLSSQLTVAYIVGGLLNLPLLALQWADALPVSQQTASFLKALSFESRFEPLGRGLVSLTSVFYFLSIPVIALVICVLLLTFRFWSARRPWFYGGHYLVRLAAITLLALSLLTLLDPVDRRFDWTAEKLSTLSESSLRLIRKQSTQYPVEIEAWLSPELPQEFVQTRLDIISVLSAIKSLSGNNVFVEIHETSPNTKEAYRLERQYDIRPRKVVFDVRGRMREESIFLSLVFRCGPKTLKLPFINRGLSVEYELVSALLSIGDRPRPTLGIVKTMASLLGRSDSQGNPVLHPWSIVEELTKQYQIEEVDPTKPIPVGKYNALLAVQPSTLSPAGMLHFADAIRQGVPALIFEDPYPIFVDFLPGTTIPNTGRQPILLPPGSRGDPGILWAMLGTRLSCDVLWKNYNPYPKLAILSEEYLFVDAKPIDYQEKGGQPAAKTKRSPEAFDSSDEVVASLRHLLFPFCGSFQIMPNAETTIVPLIQTTAGGYTAPDQLKARGLRTSSDHRIDREGVYTLAARIKGNVPQAFRKPNVSSRELPVFDVIVVSDVDFMTPGFFRLREMGTDLRNGVTLDFDNVSFVMNAIDSIAGQADLIPIRTRQPRHRTLTRIEEATRRIRDHAMVQQIAAQKEFEAYRRQEEEKLQKTIEKLANRVDPERKLSQEESTELQTAIVGTQQRLSRQLEEKQMIYDRQAEESQREVDEFVRTVQGRYKLIAVLLPPLPPLLIGGSVYFYRKRKQKVRL